MTKHYYYHHPGKTHRALPLKCYYSCWKEPSFTATWKWSVMVLTWYLLLTPFLPLGLCTFTCWCFPTHVTADTYLNNRTHISHFIFLILHYSTLQRFSQRSQLSSLLRNLSHGYTCHIRDGAWMFDHGWKQRERGRGEKEFWQGAFSSCRTCLWIHSSVSTKRMGINFEPSAKECTPSV